MKTNKVDILVKFKPAGKRVLVLADEANDKSAGGVLLTENTKERPQIGTVIKVGSDSLLGLYQVGDRVMYGKNAGIKIDIDTYEKEGGEPTPKEFYLMQESELFGTI